MSNQLLSPSQNPYQWPEFQSLTAEDYVVAARQGAAWQLEELEAITSNIEPATFDNTLVALEASGQVLRRTLMTYFTVLSAHGTEDLRAIQSEMSSIMTRQQDAIHLNETLYSRLRALNLDSLQGEDARLAEQTLREFEQAGAALGSDAKDKLSKLNEQISELASQFSNLALENQNKHAVHFADAVELEGLGDAAIAAAAKAALDAGHQDGFLLPLVSPSQQPVLSQLARSESRRKVHEASLSRGLKSTLELAAQMASLRAERASVLGFANHAETVLAEATAPSITAVAERLAELTAPAVRNANAEAEILSNLAGAPINAWDWRYYSEKVLQEKFSVDTSALREYFELERVLVQGVFATATRLYGITFNERFDLPGYHPDVRVWEVFDADGSALALYTGDFLARPTKKGGAWMTTLRDGASLLNERPIVTNTLNIAPPADGEPVLLTLDETNTLFHEFGHALHGMFANGKYASLSGTSVPRDFVEFPSQVNEMWALHEDVVGGYAKHYATDAPLDPSVLESLRASELWGQGFATTEYLAASVLDWAWHTIEPGTVIADPEEFEQRVLVDAGFDPQMIAPRYRTGYFQHIFANGYSAGYYSYIWSEVLDADTVQWFAENGGLMRENGNRFREELLSRGNTRDPLESYRLFRGRNAEIEPLLRRRGLVNAEK